MQSFEWFKLKTITLAHIYVRLDMEHQLQNMKNTLIIKELLKSELTN